MTTSLNPLCTATSPELCDTNDLVRTPVKLFSRRQFTFPMSKVDIESNFPPEYDIFRAFSTVTGVTQPISNLMGGDQVPCPFLLCGVCVQVTPELDSWTLPVDVVDTNVAGFNGPDVPANNGVIDAAAVPLGRRKGSAEWGGATQRFAVDFLLAYRLRFLLQCKYEIFDQPLSDIGCVDAAGNMSAVGTTSTPAGPGLQKMNAQLAALGSRWRVNPQNLIPGAGQAQTLAPAPTVDVQRGGISFQGSMAGFYLCPAPVLLAPCCRINMSFYQGEGTNMYLPLAKEEASDLTAAPATVSPDVWTSGTIAGTAGPGAATDALIMPVKGGHVALGITLLGWNLTPDACRQYFMQGMPEGLYDMYSAIPNMPGQAAAEAAARLAARGGA